MMLWLCQGLMVKILHFQRVLGRKELSLTKILPAFAIEPPVFLFRQMDGFAQMRSRTQK
jgi:hypothetical protein